MKKRSGLKLSHVRMDLDFTTKRASRSTMDQFFDMFHRIHAKANQSQHLGKTRKATLTPTSTDAIYFIHLFLNFLCYIFTSSILISNHQYLPTLQSDPHTSFFLASILSLNLSYRNGNQAYLYDVSQRDSTKFLFSSKITIFIYNCPFPCGDIMQSSLTIRIE